MDVALFDYELPPERIAQVAVEPRDAARLMVFEREGGAEPEDRVVSELPDLLNEGDLLVVNDVAVRPARLRARRPTGGAVELLLVAPLDEDSDARWRAMGRAARPLRPGDLLSIGDESVVRIVGPTDDGAALVIEFSEEGGATRAMEAHGSMPLPPYIKREEGDPRLEEDLKRYQTMFASRGGAVAAPTAGLHFTPGLVHRLEASGVELAAITLDVGEGTFRNVRVETTEEIALPSERTRLPPETALAIAEARRRGGRVIAVGTTVVRTLEGRAQGPGGGPLPGAAETDIVITPGYRFRWIDGLMTNFHLPKSTLVMLVAAFAGRERVLECYRQAVDRGYRFYSYGDAMLVF